MFLFFLIFTLFSFNLSASEILINAAVSNLNFADVLKLNEKKINLSKINLNEVIKRIKEDRIKHDKGLFANKIEKCNDDYHFNIGIANFSSCLLVNIIVINGAYKEKNKYTKKDAALISFFTTCMNLFIYEFFIHYSIKGKKILKNLRSAYAIKKLSHS